MNNKKIYTIGHSNLTFENFCSVLKYWNINCLIDVRSTPYTSYTPHFNKEMLSAHLKKNGIIYLHFGDEFGARPQNKEMYNEKKIVDFKKMTKRLEFQKGVERLENGLGKNYKMILMCSCQNPMNCHRFIMISKYLTEKKNFIIQHIFPNSKTINAQFTKNEKSFIVIKENHQVLEYYIKEHRDLEEIDKQNYSIDLFQQNIDEIYFQEKNNQIGYKLEL